MVAGVDEIYQVGDDLHRRAAADFELKPVLHRLAAHGDLLRAVSMDDDGHGAGGHVVHGDFHRGLACGLGQVDGNFRGGAGVLGGFDALHRNGHGPAGLLGVLHVLVAQLCAGCGLAAAVGVGLGDGGAGGPAGGGGGGRFRPAAVGLGLRLGGGPVGVLHRVGFGPGAARAAGGGAGGDIQLAVLIVQLVVDADLCALDLDLSGTDFAHVGGEHIGELRRCFQGVLAE